MEGKILVSTAYLPPVEYFSIISEAEEIFVEREENYHKQTYRNRCYIMSSGGVQILTVPVFLGSLHKTHLKDIRIDYSKRWQQVHLRAITASYGSSPYYQFYFENIEKAISKKHIYLLDLNTELTEIILEILRLQAEIKYTSVFEPVNSGSVDFRYNISPKKESDFRVKDYTRVFNNDKRHINFLSIIDLVFNMGPEAAEYL
jgi:hypothetical protein